jgi:hypothetical protein
MAKGVSNDVARKRLDGALLSGPMTVNIIVHYEILHNDIDRLLVILKGCAIY